ncbi:nuclear transport factor 2 family protein [Gulosibacter sp. 10]|uniref:nuclear transport factor 2 family protein n=1 Tax=Gulosibacter sp. 10 TaxID=1255570 RepID=UPI00097F2123|nr:nuclear transport factor 2 family protein [Gulosibacter sp. 10]SJM71338.1 Ketosteroid isomerase-related protein [Gulosibacter sp. 10]
MSTGKALVERHYAAGAAGDAAGMFADFSPRIAWTEMAGSPYAGTFVGPDEVRANVFERIGADFAEFGFVPERILAEGDVVAAIGDYRGVRRDGEAFRCRAVHVWEVSGEEIVRFEQFADTALF